MPRDANGNYTLPGGNPVQTETIITSVWANTTMADLANEMQDSLSRSGKGALTAPLGIVDGTGGGVPGLSFQAEPTSGIRRAGTGDVRVQVVGVDNLRCLQTNRATDVWNNDLSTPTWERAFTTPSANVLDGNVEKTVQIKRETAAAAVPVSLAEGELAANVEDDPPVLFVGGTGGTTVKPFVDNPGDLVRFPSGTIQVFEAPAAAPTGWVKKTDAAYDDVAMRVVTGVLTQGGTHAFSVLFADLAEGAAPGVGNHTLTISEMPSHQHGGGAHTHNIADRSGGGPSNVIDYTPGLFQTGSVNANILSSGTIIGLEGGGLAHSHALDNKLKYRDVYFAEKS